MDDLGWWSYQASTYSGWEAWLGMSRIGIVTTSHVMSGLRPQWLITCRAYLPSDVQCSVSLILSTLRMVNPPFSCHVYTTWLCPKMMKTTEQFFRRIQFFKTFFLSAVYSIFLTHIYMPGWWCNNHLEKYESQWEGWHPIYEMDK